MKKRQLIILYDIFIVVLALVTIHMVYMDIKYKGYSNNTLLDEAIYVIFLLDYLVRFYFSKDKKKFIKSNVVELIAIIPFALFLRSLKLLRLIKVAKTIKFFSVFGKLYKRIASLITTNKFHYLLVITLLISLASTILVSYYEKITFFNAFWWSIVTITTVGYGDITISTPEAKIVTMLLMLVGIGLIGSLTSTLTTYFLRKRKFISPNPVTSTVLNSVIDQLMGFENLTLNDIEKINKILVALKGQDIENTKKEVTN